MDGFEHRAIADDPLDGLVNLFDVGMILAIAFLIAGLGLTLNPRELRVPARGRLALLSGTVATAGRTGRPSAG